MEWILGAVALLIVLGFLFRGSDVKPVRPGRRKAASAENAAVKASYAQLRDGDSFLPLTAKEVDEMFAEARAKLKEYRSTANAVRKMSEKFDRSGEIDEVAFERVKRVNAEAVETIKSVEALYDRLFFEKDSAAERHYRIVEDLHEAQSDIESDMDDVQLTRDLIASGDFEPTSKT